MVRSLLDTLPDHAEFDLDVRLQAVARRVWDERDETKPGPEGTVTCSCEQCPTGVTCGC
jgi:hypothetical protein